MRQCKRSCQYTIVVSERGKSQPSSHTGNSKSTPPARLSITSRNRFIWLMGAFPERKLHMRTIISLAAFAAIAIYQLTHQPVNANPNAKAAATVEEVYCCDPIPLCPPECPPPNQGGGGGN